MQAFLSIVYGLGISIFIAYALLATYHALKFRYLSKRSKKLTMVFLAVSGIVGSISLYLFFTIDWALL